MSAPDALKGELEVVAWTNTIILNAAPSGSDGLRAIPLVTLDQAQSLLDAERAAREKAERERDGSIGKDWKSAFVNASNAHVAAHARAEAAEAKLAEAVKAIESITLSLSEVIMLENDTPARGERLNQIWRELAAFLQSQDKEGV